MENKDSKALNAVIGVLGVGIITLSIILFTVESAGLIFKQLITAILQIDMGLLLIIYGIKENRTKGKPKGNMHFTVGLAVLTSTAYTIYNLIVQLAQ